MTATRPPTLDQTSRDLVVKDRRTSFCVEAGAGTGKTSLMVERIVDQVLHGIPIARIAAITFTEKAAAELKLRVRQRLEACSSVDDKAREALARLDSASISTIHGFAASLLRERPVEARLDPNFTQLDELASGLLLDRGWESWLEKALGDRQEEALKHALLLGLRLIDLKQLFVRLYRSRKYLSRLPDAPCRLEEACARVDALIAEAREYEPFCIFDEDLGVGQWRRLFASYEKERPGASVAGLIRFCASLSIKTHLGKQGNWKRDYGKRQKEAAVKLRGIAEDVRASIVSELLRVLAGPEGAIAAVEAEKQERDILDFDDLLLKTRDLLSANPGVRRYFQEQYDSLIVDEFQDTDPLQVELAFFLSEDGASARTWRDVKLKPGKLCIVGDPKQSIYRFRGADIETYTEAKESIAGQGRVVAIQENFRSSRKLVEWINTVFGRVIRETETYQPDYQDLLSSQPPVSDALPAVTLLCSPADKRDERKPEAAAVVAALGRIRREQWPVRDPKGGATRAACWSDMAVLMRASTESHEYEAALRAAGVPYRLESGRQFFARQEIHALVGCLKCIDDPGDTIALAAALKSLFFGFSDEDLLRLKLATGTVSYLKPPDAASGQHADLAGALALLRSLHEDRNRVSLGATLERLYRETWALEKHLLTYAGRQAAANLQKAVARARAFESMGGTTFRRFARWLHALTEELPQEPESSLVESEEDAVQVLTIHKAKGLEFPIVLMANLTTRAESDPVLWNRQSQTLEVRVKVQNDEFCTTGFDAAKAEEKRRAEAEERRLLYVAATRARDYLLISAFLSGARAEIFSLLELESPSIPEGVDECECSGVRWWRVPPLLLPRDPELSPAVEVQSESAPVWEERRESWMRHRSSAIERAALSLAPLSASGLKAVEAERSFISPGMASAQKAASALGTAFHRLLYRLDLEDLRRLFGPAADGASPPSYLGPLASQTALECGLESSADLLGLLRNPGAPLLAPLFAGASRILREVPFLIPLPMESQGEQGTSLWEGVIDVILEQPDGSIVVLDYKTDNVKETDVERRMESYAAQGNIYRAAVEHGTGRQVDDVLFYFVRPGVVYSDRLRAIR